MFRLSAPKLLICLGFLISSFAFAAKVPFLFDPDRSLEPLYAEAVLDYQGEKHDLALEKINRLLSFAQDRKSLELKALILKAKNRIPEARKTYVDLLEQVRKISKRPIDLAPAYFEIALLDFKLGKFDTVRDKLGFCIKNGYNVGAASLFHGLLDLENKNYPAAGENLTRVLTTDAEGLKPLAHLYLARLSGEEGELDSTLRNLFSAKTLVDAPMVDLVPPPADLISFRNQVRDKINASLEPMNVSRAFGNVTTAVALDSNVLSAPGNGSIPGTSTGLGSATGILKAAIGFASKPMSSLQWVPSYQTSINYNANRNTETGQFVTHDLTLFLNRTPYERTSFGGKFEGIGLFQYEVDPDTRVGSFGPYSLQASFGPYYRREIHPHQLLMLELYFEPRRNFLDPAFSPAARKSGYDLTFKPSLTWDRHARFWNPTWTVVAGLHRTEGSEYRSISLSLSLQDTLHLNDKMQGTLSGSMGISHYPDRPSAPRFDKTAILDANLTRLLSSRISLFADFQFQLNLSDVVDIYQYHRAIVSMGASYSL